MDRHRGLGGRRRGLRILLMLMVVAAVTGDTYKLRKEYEPFIYKNLASRTPQIFPFQTLSHSTSGPKETKMLLGMCAEDKQIIMKTPPATSPLSVTQQSKSTTTENNIQDVLENMVEVMEMEKDISKSKDQMLPALKKMVTAVDSTIKLQTRMAPQTSNQTLINFQKTVMDFLTISGIEALLPLDCGKHPKRPENPLPSRGTYPWLAALGSHEDGRFHYRCIGVLISQHHILTDADCAASPNINVVMMNVTDAPGPGAIVNFVAGRRVHPSIKDNDQDLLSGNNIGILELALPYEFSDYVQPICLAGQFDDPDPNETSEVTIFGYQAIDLPTGRISGLYNWPKSPTLGSSTCFIAIKALKEENPEEKTTLEDILTRNHLCVDRNFELVGKSVILRVDEKTERVRVVGLGAVANAAKTNPIAYTLVQPHRFWVELVLKKFKDNTAPRKPSTPLPELEA